MASLKGPLLFTGSIGNIKSYYSMKLKRYVLCTKGGPSAELIKNSPAFARTRENMLEFGACGKFSSQLRRTLLLLSHLFDSFYFNEMVRMTKKILINDDQHPRGRRSIEASKHSRGLVQLKLNRKHPLEEVFWGDAVVELQSDHRTVTLTLKDFITSRSILWPSRFSSWRLSLLIGQLSDWAFDPALSDYAPLIPDLEQRSVMVRSEWLPRSCDAIDLTLTAAFREPVVQQAGSVVVVALGIEIFTGRRLPMDCEGVRVGTVGILECGV